MARLSHRVARRSRSRRATSRLLELLETRTLLSTIYVDASAPGVTQDGTAWGTAYLDLQAALTVAGVGDEVRVANGTYKPTTGTNRTISFQLENEVTLLGGYGGFGHASPDTRDIVANATILSGNIGNQASALDNSYHVVNGSGTLWTAVIRGFRITDGRADGVNANSRGAGMYNSGGSPMISDCTFTNNATITTGNAGLGGAIYNSVGSHPNITDTTFTGNSAVAGAGIYCDAGSIPFLTRCTFTSNSSVGQGTVVLRSTSVTLTDCTFTSNTAQDGAAMDVDSSSIILEGCSFTQNSASLNGGAIRSTNSTLTLTDCTFTSNTAYAGGAMYATGTGTLSATGCTFSQNQASGISDGAGGAICARVAMDLTDCSFVGNSARKEGGAIITLGGGTLENCTFTNNSALGMGGAISGTGSPTLIDINFTGNSAVDGGAIYFLHFATSPTLTRCQFIENVATRLGGAIRQYNYGTPLFTSCSFIRNTSGLAGGAVAEGNGVAPTFLSCLFNGNSTDGDGGAAYLAEYSGAKYINSTFVGNTAAGRGGALYIGPYVGPGLVNCTMVSNSATLAGGTIYAGAHHEGAASSTSIANSIIWGGSSGDGSIVQFVFSNLAIDHSDIQGGWAGVGNIDSDPLFLTAPNPGGDGSWGTSDDQYGNLGLSAASGAVDSGGNSAVPANVFQDLGSLERFSDVLGVRDPGAIVDMGSYERVGVFGVTTTSFNADSMSLALTFSRNMTTSSISATDLEVRAILPDGSAGAAVSVVGHAYSAATRTATFTLPVSMADGNYRATLIAGSVSDTTLTPMAADHASQFHILAGDANGDRVVDVRDLVILSANWYGSDKVFTQGDFNRDGVVNQQDLTILAQRWQARVDVPPPPPAPAPPAPTVAGRRTPIRTPARAIGLVS